MACQILFLNVLLTDLFLPRKSGPKLARRLAGFHPAIEILYMSGDTGNVIAHHGVLDEVGVSYADWLGGGLKAIQARRQRHFPVWERSPLLDHLNPFTMGA